MQRVLTLSVLTATMLLMVGCGRTLQTPPPLSPIAGSPSYSDPNAYPGSGYTDPNAYPGSGYTDPNAYPGGGGYTDPNGYNPYDPNSGGGMNVPLVAKIDKQKNGKILGLGTYVVNVSVSNPSSNEQTGRLRVSILDKGESIRDFTEQITVPAGQTVTRTFSDKRWIADNATVSVSPMPASDPYASSTQGANQGYGSSDPYASGSYGSAGGSGYPTSGGSYGSADPYANSGYGSTAPYGNTGGYPATGSTYGSYNTNPNTRR